MTREPCDAVVLDDAAHARHNVAAGNLRVFTRCHEQRQLNFQLRAEGRILGSAALNNHARRRILPEIGIERLGNFAVVRHILDEAVRRDDVFLLQTELLEQLVIAVEYTRHLFAQRIHLGIHMPGEIRHAIVSTMRQPRVTS